MQEVGRGTMGVQETLGERPELGELARAGGAGWIWGDSAHHVGVWGWAQWVSERSGHGVGRGGRGVPDLVLETANTSRFPPKAFDARWIPGRSESKQGATRAGSTLVGRQVGSKDAQPLTYSPPLGQGSSRHLFFFLFFENSVQGALG